jgi:predicted nucleotidyltransferase component of viral defense system
MVERIQVTESFVRLKVTADAESTILDLAYDARLTDPTETDLGRTLSLEELAADKTLALFGRGAARDFIDVDTLAQLFGHDRLLELAAAKDRGFDVSAFTSMLYDELRTRITDWARSLADSPVASTDQLGDLDQADDRGPGRDR